MIALAFFSWWYGRGWNDTAHSMGRRIDALHRAFSVRLLLKTLFSPWRRIITNPGASMEEHVKALGDNIVSRFIGFFVRLLVLIGALIATILVILLTVIEVIAWPLLPPAIIACLILGAIG
jgi:hypothetical protein